MRLHVTRDVERFAAAVDGFLAERIETNVMATVLWAARSADPGDRPALMLYGTDDGRVACAAMRTPPLGLLASPMGAVLADAVMERWYPLDPDVPWVVSVPDTAHALAAAWARRSGGRSEVQMAEGMFQLTKVSDPPRPGPGALRRAEDGDRGLLTVWLGHFAREARITIPDPATAVGRRVGTGQLYVWDDGGPVSFLGVNRPVAGVVRLGPVYTPPGLRRRGYAGSAVAAASRLALVDGAWACMLFTDLSNPTSNKIYGEVGYRRVRDFAEVRLIRDRGAAPAA
jgi:hypothetical protein